MGHVFFFLSGDLFQILLALVFEKFSQIDLQKLKEKESKTNKNRQKDNIIIRNPFQQKPKIKIRDYT